MDVPLVDLRAQYAALKEELDAAIAGVLESSCFIGGEELTLFEKEFASYLDAALVVGVSSGTAALHLALLALGIGPGHEVITVPFSFAATAEAIVQAGARPVFVDIDPRTYTIDPEKVEAAITPKARAIIAVHLYGHPADMSALAEIARRRRLFLVEDAAQAHGARYHDRPVGALGDVGCFSFYPSKNLGAYGDAGAVATNDDGIARMVRLLRDHGRTGKYLHGIVGFNHRLDSLQAAVLRVKLRRLERWNEGRRQKAELYRRLLRHPAILHPVEMAGCRHVFHLYVIRCPQRDAVLERLTSNGVDARVHYPVPIHLLEAYAFLGYREGSFPVTEQAAREVLSLPMYPELSEAQIAQVADLVVSALG